MKWPAVLYDENMFHKTWLGGPNPIADCHSKIRDYRDDDHYSKSVARIHLSVPVEKGILTVECMQFSGSPGAKIVYADLRPFSAAEKKKKLKSNSLIFNTF